MNLRARFLLFPMVALAAACGGDPTTTPTGPDLAAVDSLFSAYTGDVPGAAVLVLQDGEPIVARTYGLAHLETRTPVDPATNFRLASVTKQFTATAILQLVADGRLSLDDTLPEIFPTFPEYASGIRVRHLLSHTSGLIDYESLMPDTTTIPVLDADVLELMMGAESTYFEPGSEYRYSNSGYAVLAMIVERKSGKRFAEYLAENLFEPAGMDSTVAFESGRNTVTKRAFGYSSADSGFVFSDQTTTSSVLGDGGIYSSVVDLAAWDRALGRSSLVDSTTWRMAWTPQVAVPDSTNPGASYGFGWQLDRYLGYDRMQHTGSTSGFRNVIQRYPGAQTTIVILTNRAGPNVAPLADLLAGMVLRGR